LAKVAAYDQQRLGRSFLCRCNQALNTVAKEQAVGPGARAELWLYPDVVGVTGRTERLGCLALLLALPALLLVGPFALLMAIPAVLLRLLFYPIELVLGWLWKMRLDQIARRIRENPNSSYAIKKLFKYCLLQPRFWQRGEVAQLVRVNVKRFLCGSRALLLIVQHEPIPRRPGCLEALLPMFIARRRVYYVWTDQGEAAADEAAQAAAQVLGIEVVRGQYRRNKLQLP
jgi:hypothetical protein